MKSNTKFTIFSEDKEKTNIIIKELNESFVDEFSTKNGFVITSQEFVDLSSETLNKIKTIIGKHSSSYLLSWFSDAIYEGGFDMYEILENGKYSHTSTKQSLNAKEITEFEFLLLCGKKDYIEKVFYGI